MTQRHFVTRWLGALGLTLALVGLISQGMASAQTTSLAEIRQDAEQGNATRRASSASSTPPEWASRKTTRKPWRGIAKRRSRAMSLRSSISPIMYRDGRGVPQDDAQAVAWYRKAAEQGYASAQFTLGLRYAEGEGVLQDFRLAVAWFRKAADQGYALAQYNLGYMYGNGEGVPQDYVEAHKWRNIAASRVTGDQQKEYAATRDSLAKQMTPAQLAEAQQLAREWQAAFEAKIERLLDGQQQQ